MKLPVPLVEDCHCSYIKKLKKKEEKLTYNAHLKKIKWRIKNVKLTTTQSTFVR
jgi:hypothetical protein